MSTKSHRIQRHDLDKEDLGDDNDEAPTHPQRRHIGDPYESPTHSQLHHADDQYGLPTHNQHRHVGGQYEFPTHNHHRHDGNQYELPTHNQHRHDEDQYELPTHNQHRHDGDQYELPTHNQHRHDGDQYELPTHNQHRHDGDQYELPPHNQHRHDGIQYELPMHNQHRYDEDKYEVPTHNHHHHAGDQYELQTNPLHSHDDFVEDKTHTLPRHRTTRPSRSKTPENTPHPRRRMNPTNHHITMQQNQRKRTFAPTRRSTRIHHRTTAEHKHTTPVHKKTTHHHTPTRAMYHQATPHHTTRHHTVTRNIHHQATPHHTTRHRIPTKPRTRPHSTHHITHRRTSPRHPYPPRTTRRLRKVPTKRKHTPTKNHKPTFNMDAILRSIKEIVQPKIKRDSQPRPAPTPDVNSLPVPKPYVLPLHDPTRLRILCFGDSLTAGYYKHGKAFFPYCSPMRNMISSGTHLPVLADAKGIVGEMTHKQMTNRLPLVLGNATSQYDWVIILGGTNDILHVKNFADDQEFLNQLENVWQPRITKDIEKLHSISYKYGAHTLLLTVPENAVEAWPEYKPLMEMRNKINKALKRFAYSSNGLTVFCDTAKKLPRHSLSPAQESALWDDHLHMTPTGYTKMARVISECLEPYLPHRRAG